jgi:UDP-N-acetylmuramoylalanine--D-glutamate ligase
VCLVKKTLVLGTGRSGLAATQYLLKQGKSVVVSDNRSREQVQASPNWPLFETLENEHPGKLEWALGGHPLELLDRCSEIVISPGISLHVPFLAEALRRGVTVKGEMELAYKAGDRPLVAVTGTNGKSTTCSLLGNMFADKGVVGGNIGTPLLDQVQNLEASVQWVVAEVSSFQLETVHEFSPKIGILTNISPDHLDHHKDLDEYRIAKSRLFAQMDKTCTAIFCQEDESCRQMAQQVRDGQLPEWIEGFPTPKQESAPKVLTYSVNGPVENGISLIDGTVVRYQSGEAQELFDWDYPGLPGKAMTSNGLAAIAAALEAGLNHEEIQSGLRRFQPLRYRMEVAGVVNGVTYINDSKATNIDSALASAHSVDGSLAVIVGGKDKGVDYTSLAQGLKDRNGRVFLIGEAADPIEKKLNELDFRNLEHSHTMERALNAATTFLEGDGTVLLAPACSSFDQFKSAEQRGQIFNDLVKNLSSGVGVETRSVKS